MTSNEHIHIERSFHMESDEAYELRCLRHKVSRYDIERKKALAQARQLKVDFQDRDDDRDQLREKLAKVEMEIVNKTAEIKVHVAHAASEQKGVQGVERELVLAQSQLRRQAESKEWAMNELHLRGEKIGCLNERTKHLINERDGEMWRAECAEAGRPHAP
jgi:predicted  nucleic acid-binding Zn-ribbon protein